MEPHLPSAASPRPMRPFLSGASSGGPRPPDHVPASWWAGRGKPHTHYTFRIWVSYTFRLLTFKSTAGAAHAPCNELATSSERMNAQLWNSRHSLQPLPPPPRLLCRAGQGTLTLQTRGGGGCPRPGNGRGRPPGVFQWPAGGRQPTVLTASASAGWARALPRPARALPRLCRAEGACRKLTARWVNFVRSTHSSRLAEEITSNIFYCPIGHCFLYLSANSFQHT